ncbi:hypothetical protein ACIP97_13875 [Peribacillus frigoritolerans]|uniref:hypothetical protein n=1 Tax=Peribacillus frigoritolerans TaxID=450367 RepID=UPI003823148B
MRLKQLNGLIRYFASWFKGRYWERANEKPPGVGKGAFLANQFTMPPCLVIELGLLVIGNVPMDLEIFPIRALPIKADKDGSYLLFQPILEQPVNIYRLK